MRSRNNNVKVRKKGGLVVAQGGARSEVTMMIDDNSKGMAQTCGEERLEQCSMIG